MSYNLINYVTNNQCIHSQATKGNANKKVLNKYIRIHNKLIKITKKNTFEDMLTFYNSVII